jgi:hypothetical protein
MRKETKNTIKISQMNTLITKIMIQIFELHNFTHRLWFLCSKSIFKFFLNYFYFKLIIFIILNGFDILISKINFKK